MKVPTLNTGHATAGSKLTTSNYVLHLIALALIPEHRFLRIRILSIVITNTFTRTFESCALEKIGVDRRQLAVNK